MISLRSKFILFVSVLLLMLLIMLNTYPIISSREAVFQEKQSSFTSQASVVASSLAGLDRLSSEGVTEVLRFLDLENYSRIVVTDDAGSVVFDDNGTESPDLKDLPSALSGKATFRSRFADAAFNSSITMPITAQNTIIGAVVLFEHDAERGDIIHTIQSNILLLSGIIGLVAILLAVLFSDIVVRRLDSLISSMRTVAAGDYHYRHTVTGGDEISEMGNEFNALTERLETNEAQRRRFVSDASHELKTPLASIRLLSDSILQTENMDNATMREFVSDIGNEAIRLQRTSEKLLDLSRLDDSVEIVEEPVDLKQVTLDALPLLMPLARENEVTFRTELEDGCVVMATQDDMNHVVFNLAENAIKYNVPGGSVLVRLYQTDEQVKLSVEDTGIGIPEEERYNIFTRFYRIDKARSRARGGSGLGLSIVHDAVTAHGGSIAVGQNKPQGSVFIVSFPRPSSEETGI
ncbi:MAG: HAMP domain-containing histidine kinase [Oscillospiraceae bacterium]|nr:HAMP domain-containing histidine kinase [Oscillospiraceae bacterium]